LGMGCRHPHCVPQVSTPAQHVTSACEVRAYELSFPIHR
jgi:hypothetical protein